MQQTTPTLLEATPGGAAPVRLIVLLLGLYLRVVRRELDPAG